MSTMRKPHLEGRDAQRDQNVMIEGGNITGYKVNVEITFQLEDGS